MPIFRNKTPAISPESADSCETKEYKGSGTIDSPNSYLKRLIRNVNY